MDQAMPSAPTPPLTDLGGDWFDPLEDAVRGQVRAFIERLLEEELEAALGRGRYARDLAAKGHRNGHRERRLDTTFGPLVLAVPRARLADHDTGEREWRSELLPAYRRLSRRAELLIAEVYLAGVNTRRVRRALQALFAGRIGKDAVSRAWRRTRAAWEAWQQRDLADDDIVRLILDGTVVKVRLDRKATAISLLIALGVRRDGQKVVLAIKNLGGETEAAWRAVLDDLLARRLAKPDLVIVDGGKGLEAALASLWDDVPVQRCSVGLLKNPGFREIHPDLVGLLGEPHEMLGRKERRQPELFVAGSLRDVLPDDHVLVRVDRVLDLSWLHDEIADLYDAAAGRPSIDPEVAVRLMLAGFLLGIVHDRRLLREAQVNLAIRWFCGYGLHEALPDHSSLTRIRQRWGAERFRRIFERTVRACVDAKIAKGEVVHVDASLIRADVSWESLAVRHVEVVSREHEAAPDEAEKVSRKSGKYKKVCTTDPDATMATSARNRRLEPAYKQHAVVDDVRGVILDVEVTTGALNEGQVVIERIDAAMATTGTPIATVTADAGYAYAKIYGELERRGIDALIPTKAEPIRSAVPLRRFRYDARNDLVRCPRGKILRPGRPITHGRFFYSRAKDCARCPLAAACLSRGRVNKAVVISAHYPALLRARRRRERWSAEDARLYQRHRWRSEGFHGEAKTWHGLARAVRRGLQNMRIQAFLTAAAVNLKRLAAALLTFFLALWSRTTAARAAPRLLPAG